jgi:hypothetical protein
MNLLIGALIVAAVFAVVMVCVHIIWGQRD